MQEKQATPRGCGVTATFLVTGVGRRLIWTRNESVMRKVDAPRHGDSEALPVVHVVLLVGKIFQLPYTT